MIMISDHPGYFFELPELAYDRTALLGIVSDQRYSRFWFNWHLDISYPNGEEKHTWTATDGTEQSDLRTIDFGNLRRKWLDEGQGDGTLGLIRHPALTSILSRINPEIGLTEDNFHINIFAPGQTYPAHVDKGRDAAIMLPLDPPDAQIEFWATGGKIRHTYNHPTVLNVKEKHWPVPNEHGHRIMGAIAIQGTSYQRCLELAYDGTLVLR